MTRREEQLDDTGKRGAVRNNSGLPVDHSGPELGVGPTDPVTAGRNPAACPPDHPTYSSQHKSGRRSRRQSLLGAAEGSPGLRSEAEQPTSLDLIEINRYTNAPRELKKRGRRSYCGMRSLRGRSRDERTERVVRLDCKTWGCAYCGPRKAWRYKQAITTIAVREQLSRFLTLTLDPFRIEGDPVRYLRSVFSKFRVYLLRRYGHPIKFIAVLEFHKSGIPHLHVLVDRYIPQQWIAESWSALGGGNIVHIKYVDVHRIAHYLAKYLTKELLLSAPDRSRRVTTSRSIHLNEKQPVETTWVMDKRSIFLLFELLHELASDVELDKEDFICAFVVPAGAETPPWANQPEFIRLTLGRFGNVCFAVLVVW